MTLLADILSALDQWDEWKEIRETPAKVEELQRRIAELEGRLKRAGQACPACGALEFRIEKSVAMQPPFGALGVREHHWKCKKCGYTDTRTEMPK